MVNTSPFLNRPIFGRFKKGPVLPIKFSRPKNFAFCEIFGSGEFAPKRKFGSGPGLGRDLAWTDGRAKGPAVKTTAEAALATEADSEAATVAVAVWR